MEPLGQKIRRARHAHRLTLDDLAARATISKPYLSLIETGRVKHPPSDEKLQRLEQSLGFAPGELVSQAHLLRTPRDIRLVLEVLANEGGRPGGAAAAHATAQADPPAPAGEGKIGRAVGISLDAAYFSGVLQQLVDHTAGNVETIRLNAVPVINHVSAGYPKDFTDLSYPRGHADAFVNGPDVEDPEVFAARVFGDSMQPKYHQGDIVLFSPAAVPRHGDDCFVRFVDGQTTFKRVFFEQDADGRDVLRLQPRNEKYRPQTINPEVINGIYRAVFRYQPIDAD